MRTALIITAVVLFVLAIPALVRLDSALRVENRSRARIEGGRFLLAVAAAAGLLVMAGRTR